MRVLKFGGTSVASAERLIKVSEIVKGKYEQHKGLCVIVSAFSGITDLLIQLTEHAREGKNYDEKLRFFQSKVYEVANGLLDAEIVSEIKDET